MTFTIAAFVWVSILGAIVLWLIVETNLMTVEICYRKAGARLKDSRIKAKRTQQWVSDHAGIGRTAIANFEAGRQRMMLHHILAAAKVLRVKIADVWQ